VTIPVVLHVLEDKKQEGEEQDTSNAQTPTSTTTHFADGGQNSPTLHAAASSSFLLPSVVRITLDPSEHDLVQTLLGTAQALQRGDLVLPERPNVRNVQVRIAGGWVRDKVLGLSQTHDVDIALDTCSGIEFATLVQQYLQLPHQHSHAGKPTPTNTKIGVIAANPSQSKHLETATTKIYGMDVDYSNLRHEDYSDPNSRIPTIVCGTPYQDAYRRDFTMNALYYHVQHNVIEDWTHRGISDLLHQPMITTPLPAYETFHDDPLRVLRAIRFAVRYNYPLHEDIRAAARHLAIHAALHVKVSRERVGNELQGMLKGKGANPRKALTLINELHLAGSVFLMPATTLSSEFSSSSSSSLWKGTLGVRHPQIYPPTPERGDESEKDCNTTAAANARAMAWNEGRDCLDLVPPLLACLNLVESPGLSTSAVATPVTPATPGLLIATPPTTFDESLVYMAAFLLPFYKLDYTDALSKKSSKNKTKSVIEFMMREGIKYKNKDVQDMVTVMEQVSNMAKLLENCEPPSLTSYINTTEERNQDDGDDNGRNIAHWQQLRLKAGLLLRSTKELWVTTMVVAGVMLCIQEASLDASSLDQDEALMLTTSQIHQRVAKWHEAFLSLPTPSSDRSSAVFQLDHCWTWKPLFNGKEISSLLQLPKGPIIGIYTQKVVEWTLQHPHGTKEACIEYLKQQKQGEATEEGPVLKKMHLEGLLT
jgi:hypothetical protein